MKKSLLIIFISLLSTISFADDTVIEVVPLSSRPASEVQPLLLPLLEDTDQVIADGANLVVKTTPERLAEIIKLINTLDSPQNNLLITVIQSDHITADELNARAGVNLNISGNGQFNSNGQITGHYSQAEGQRTNQSTQTIRTLEGNPAHISAGNAYPVQNVQIYNSGYGYPSVSTTTQLIDATSGFAVTPRLSGRQVTLDVSPWSDRLNEQGQFETQGAHSTIRVNLGEWVELGGIDESSQSSINGNLGTVRQTSQNRLRILVKVDKAN